MNGVQQPIALAIEQVTKTFTTEGKPPFRALDEIDLEIKAGQLVSLVGPSGCGKSTLLRICANLLPPTTGSVEYRDTGRPVAAGDYGIVFQTPALLPWRNVEQNILLPNVISARKDIDPQRRVDELLELVGLSNHRKKYPAELSGGMQQRTALARALFHRPALIFMDEPFGALDAMTRENLNDELQKIHARERSTILLVTHDIAEAVYLSDRIFVMSGSPGSIRREIEVPVRRPRSRSAGADPGALATLHEVEEEVRDVLFGA